MRTYMNFQDHPSNKKDAEKTIILEITVKKLRLFWWKYHAKNLAIFATCVRSKDKNATKPRIPMFREFRDATCFSSSCLFRCLQRHNYWRYALSHNTFWIYAILTYLTRFLRCFDSKLSPWKFQCKTRVSNRPLLVTSTIFTAYNTPEIIRKTPVRVESKSVRWFLSFPYPV